MYIRENKDFPQQKSSQLLSAEANFKGCGCSNPELLSYATMYITMPPCLMRMSNG